TPPEAVHLILASFMVCGFTVASVYAVGMLRGRRDAYIKRGFAIPFTFAAVTAPIQVIVGDWASRFLAHKQPLKFAALEGIAPPRHGWRSRVAFLGPHTMLSWLLKFAPNGGIRGLDSGPGDVGPPANVVPSSSQLMVGIGTALVPLGAGAPPAWWRGRDLP